MSVYEAGASKGDGLRVSMRKATRTIEKAIGAVGTSELLTEEGQAATETQGPHTWPKAKGGATEEADENAAYVMAAVFEDVTLQSGGMDGLVTKEADRKGYMFKKGKNKRDEFKKRWFELRGAQLSYFEENGGRFKGTIDIASDDCKQVRVSEAPGASQFEIEIVCSTRTYRLETRDREERRGWITALQDARHGEAAAKLRKSRAGEDPPENAMEVGSLSETTFFGEGTGAAAKMRAKEMAKEKAKEKIAKGEGSERWARPDYDGWLLKLGDKRKTWKKRWFELRGQMLRYFVEPAGEEKGQLDLRNPAVQQIRISESAESERFELEIVCTGRTYRLACAVAEDRKEWIEELHRARSGLEKVRNTGRAGVADGEDFLEGGSGLLDDAYGPEEDSVLTDDPDHCSWMAKKGARRGFSGKAWKKRWFELRGPKLEYFVDEGDEKKGEIFLNSGECEAIRVSQSKDAMANELEIVTEERIYRLVCDTREARKEWIQELQRARSGVRKNRPQTELPENEGTYTPAFADDHRFTVDEGSGEEGTMTSHAAVSSADDAGIGGTDWAAAFEDSESSEEGNVEAPVPEGVPTTAVSGSICGAPASIPSGGSLYGGLFGPADVSKSADTPVTGEPSLYGELFGSSTRALAPTESTEVEVELREDPEDGELYTKEEFIDQYGGTAEWEQATVHRFKAPAAPSGSIYDSVPEQAASIYSAVPAPPKAQATAAEVELREDPEDGELYTKEEFIDQYGGTDEWDRATVHRFKAAVPAAPAAPAAPASIYDTEPAGPSAPASIYDTEPAGPSAPASIYDTEPAGPSAPASMYDTEPATAASIYDSDPTASGSSGALSARTSGVESIVPPSALAPAAASAQTGEGSGSLYSELFDSAPSRTPTTAEASSVSGNRLSTAAEAAKTAAAAEAARIAALDSSDSSDDEDECSEDEDASFELPPMGSRERSSTVPSRADYSALGASRLPPAQTRGRSSSSPSTPSAMHKSGSPSPRGSGIARRMSLVATPVLDTLVQLTNNNIDPSNFDLNDPNALALAAVAAVDAENKGTEAASLCSSAGSGDVPGLQSFSEQEDEEDSDEEQWAQAQATARHVHEVDARAKAAAAAAAVSAAEAAPIAETASSEQPGTNG